MDFKSPANCKAKGHDWVPTFTKGVVFCKRCLLGSTIRMDDESSFSEKHEKSNATADEMQTESACSTNADVTTPAADLCAASAAVSAQAPSAKAPAKAPAAASAKAPAAVSAKAP